MSAPAAIDADRYLTLTALAAYSSLSIATLRRAIVDPAHPLPAFRVARHVLVKKSEFDRWLEAKAPVPPRAARAATDAAMDRKVAQAVRSIRGR